MVDSYKQYNDIEAGEFFCQNGIICVKIPDGRAFGMNSHGPIDLNGIDKSFRVVEPEEAWKYLNRDWQSYSDDNDSLTKKVRQLEDKIDDLEYYDRMDRL